MGMTLDFEMTPELMAMIAKEAGERIAAKAQPDASTIYDPLIGKRAAAEFLDCSTKYIDDYYMQQPGFPYHIKGRELQYRISELSKWLDTHQLYA